MKIETRIGKEIDSVGVAGYFDSLVNKFFKILPIKEQECETLDVYIDSLQSELLGEKSFIPCLETDASFMTLLFILEYLNREKPDVPIVKREVFKAIGICNKLRDAYSEGVSDE